MQIEQSRHLNWGEKIGLLEESLNQPSQLLRLHRNLILDILLEVSGCFASCLKVVSRYEEFYPEDQNGPKPSSVKQRRFLEKASSLWRAPGRTATRLRWAMIKHDKFEALITRLVGYNNAMESILDRSSLQELHTMQERSNLLLLQLTNQVSQLHVLTKALDIRTVSADSEADDISQTSTLVQTSLGSNTQLKSLAVFKIQNLTVAETSSTKDLFIRYSDLSQDNTEFGDERSLVTYNHQRVFVEWRTPLEQARNPQERELIESRLSQLANLMSTEDKPAAFRCPLCIGYCRRDDGDEIQYGLVFDASSLGRMDSDIVTLRENLEDSSPSLTQRTKLATAMAESLLYLHGVNWLHKGLRSDNIIIPNGDLTNPLISGFDFSRPDVSGEITVKSTSQAHHDYYKHPQLLQHSKARSEKLHDIYSLGLILVEIALWKPIEEIMEVITGKPLTTSQIPRISERILTGSYEEFGTVIAAIAAQAGDVFASVTKQCIEGSVFLGRMPYVDPGDSNIDKTIQHVFYDEVCLRLRTIHT